MEREKTVPEIIAQAKALDPKKMEETRKFVKEQILILQKIQKDGYVASYTESDLAEELLFQAMEIIKKR